jgi:hypothetical protein
MPRCKDCSLFRPIAPALSASQIPASDHPGLCYLTPPAPVWVESKGRMYFMRPEVRAEDEACHFAEVRKITPPKPSEDLN